MFFDLALLAYILDMFFAEFEKLKFIKHPIILIGNYIKWFEKRFYKDCVKQGVFLTLSLLSIVFIVTFTLSLFDNIFLQAFLCSFALSSNMLYTSVKNVVLSTNPKYEISMLVSRDTSDMTSSEINKAAIETYAENLSDGVIAPLFYMMFFGIVGAFLYKAINTLDSMVGYRNEKYEKYGKFSAKLDDLVNYIPSRITAVLIALFFLSKKSLTNFYSFGVKHDSPNAGHPISAMSIALKVKLGGATSYFGKIKEKPYFAFDEYRTELIKNDVQKALSIKPKLDGFIILLLTTLILSFY